MSFSLHNPSGDSSQTFGAVTKPNELVKTILLTKLSFLTAQCCTVYFTVYYCINAVNLLATHQKQIVGNTFC